MAGRYVKIFNGRVITPQRIINNGSVLVDGDKIVEAGSYVSEVPGAVLMDARGQYISPGFIDIHVHGGGGHDFMDATVEAFIGAAELHARHGTTALTPTTLSCSKEALLEIIEVYEEALQANSNGAKFIGLHFEGPYIAMSHKGAQDARYIRNPVREEYDEIIAQTNNIVRWSAAPELPGGLEFGRYLTSKNILPAFAHTDALHSDIEEAFNSGYTLATHLYSAMNGVVRRGAQRYAGAVEAAFLLDGMAVEIIADGIHLPPALLKLIYKIKGPHKTALITDAMRGAGMPEGETILGARHNGLPAIIEGGVAKLPDRSAYAGSVATADRLVRVMVQQAGVPLHDAITMVSAAPADIMRRANKGNIAAGMDADIILFDDDIRVSLTMVEGRAVFDGRSRN